MPVKYVFDNQLLGFWMLFHQTYNSILRYENKEFAKIGISTQQYAVLMAIMQTDGPVTPSQIAKLVDRNANSITLILDRMEKSGLINRVRNVDDRRSLHVSMTDKGKQILREGIGIGWKVIQDSLSDLSEEEIKTMSGTMGKLRLKAISRCYPETNLEEINIDKQHHIYQVLSNNAG